MDIKEEMRLRKWAQDMADQKASGLTQQKWCSLHGIGQSAFEYRCRRVRATLEKKMTETNANELAPVASGTDGPVFARIDLGKTSPQAISGIHLAVKGATITIAPNAPAEHVRMILEVLAHA